MLKLNELYNGGFMRKEMAGKRFGRLIVLYENGKNKCGAYMYVCRCDCGNIKTISGLKLRSGHTKSCGCLRVVSDSERIKYKTINIEGKQIRLHRYLMEQKLERKLMSDEIVHHKDGNMFNNDITNLEIVSRSEHSKKHPENLPMKRKPVVQKDLKGNVVMVWGSASAVEKEKGYRKENISKCCRKKIKRVYGYVWEFCNA